MGSYNFRSLDNGVLSKRYEQLRKDYATALNNRKATTR